VSSAVVTGGNALDVFFGGVVSNTTVSSGGYLWTTAR